MSYVYKRPGNGIFEIKYPVPSDVRAYFPKPSGNGFRTHITVSLGTRDQTEANRLAQKKFVELEDKFDVLRQGVASEQFTSFCRSTYEIELDMAAERQIGSTASPRVLEEMIRDYRAQLEDRSVDSLEATVGWLVDLYLENQGDAAAIIPSDTPLRNALLNAAADVMWDVQSKALASLRGVSLEPKKKSVHLLSSQQVSPGDNTPLSQEGRLSVSEYWNVHATIKQASSSPVRPHTLERRHTAWVEFSQVIGEMTPLFKVKKADVWAYHDALQKAPARAGSIKELRGLTFLQRIEARNAVPDKFELLDPNTIGDRLRQINAIFELAVNRGHLAFNPASIVFSGKSRADPARSPYSIDELQLIFSSAPYFSEPMPLEQQTDEFWVPLLQLFLGARSSELYVRTEDVNLDHEVPHIKLVEYEERTLKNAASSRLLPIHPMLIELGFLEYCRHAKSSWDELFPNWTFRADQRPSDGPQRRRFNRHLKTLMPGRKPRADSHTFRHNFETALSAAKNVPSRVELRLSGRAVPGSANTYVHDLLLLPDLEETIAKIRYGNLSLDHLK